MKFMNFNVKYMHINPYDLRTRDLTYHAKGLLLTLMSFEPETYIKKEDILKYTYETDMVLIDESIDLLERKRYLRTVLTEENGEEVLLATMPSERS